MVSGWQDLSHIRLPLPVDLRQARVKSAMGNLLSTQESRLVNRGRFVSDAKGA